MNPWLSIWNQPKSTLRAIVHHNPSYGVFYLSAFYALQSFFFYLNWWSVGLENEFFHLLLTALLLSPFIGIIWIYYIGMIFYFTGRLLKGTAPAAHLRTVIAWSKIPHAINLLIWFILIFTDSETVFIQDGGGPSSIFVNAIAFLLALWSVVLLVQGLSEIQQFSTHRSIANVVIAWALSNLSYLLIFVLCRFLFF
jgi:hypothetical protein